MTLFIRLLEVKDKAVELRRALSDTSYSEHFRLDLDTFAQIPGTPFAYWVSERVRSTFKCFPAFGGEGRTAKQGLATADDFRFVRARWEVAENKLGERWYGFAKGGAYSPYYADVHLVVNWEADGEEIWNNFNELGKVRSNVWMLKDTAKKFFFRSGLTWTNSTTAPFSARALNCDCVFGHMGPSAFIEDVSKQMLFLGLFNSMAFRFLGSLSLGLAEAGRKHYEVGLIQRTPIPLFDVEVSTVITQLAHRAWSLKRTLDSVKETSHAFELPEILRDRSGPYQPASITEELAAIQKQIDVLVFRLYGMDEADQQAIEQWANKGKGKACGEVIEDIEDVDGMDDSAEEADDEASAAPDGLKGLLSWCVGVAFGRFDIRLATGERTAPPEPEPFAALPVRSPGMLPIDAAPFRPTGAILVDDAGHRDDIVAVLLAVLDKVTVSDSQRPTPEDCRAWLAKEFFPLHIAIYSRSRRRAPIYWQLATPSAGYSVWLYLHNTTKDTLYQVQNEYIIPKLTHEERRLDSMRREFGLTPKASERKHLMDQTSFVQELQGMAEEIKRVAPLWKPALDDGALINFAPLWRLVPQNTKLQKELKVTWDALAAGAYDWSLQAMRLWPERVIPKCATDRSLAIAHGLTDSFWKKDDAGKWQRREKPARPVPELIAEYTSPAVKAALQNLLQAPPVIAGRKKK